MAPDADATWQTDAKDRARLTYTEYDQERRKRIEKHYHRGHLDGAWTQWYPDGSKEFVYSFANGQKDGLWLEWYPTGQRRHELRYRHGRMVGRETWWGADGGVAGIGEHPE